MKTPSASARSAYQRPEADIIRLTPEDIISVSVETERTEKQYFTY